MTWTLECALAGAPIAIRRLIFAFAQENEDPMLPPHIEEESEENDTDEIKFQLDPITGSMVVRAATLDKLIERLTLDKDPGTIPFWRRKKKGNKKSART